MKLPRIAAAVVAVALAMTGCSVPGDEESATKDSLNFVTVIAANTTDPHLVQAAFTLNSGAVETLVALDPRTSTLKPSLATKWDSKDGQNWTFTIRDGVKFHNGKTLTAEEVRKNIERARKVNPGVAKLLPIASMSTQGQTLRIRTTERHPGLPSDFVHFNTAIIDTAAGVKVPVGTGPFKIDSFDIRGETKLSRFDQYWGGRPKLAHVTMTANDDANARLLALQSGEADLIYRPSTESLDALKKDSKFTVESVPGTRVYHLIHNYAGPNARLWKNLEFRRGIDALMDRDSITRTVMSGQGVATDNPFPGKREISPAPGPTRQKGTAAALAHFSAAGLSVSGGKVTDSGKPISMTIVTYVARPELPQMAQVLENAASRVGISFKIVTADNIDEYLTQNRSRWDVATNSVNTITRGDGSYFVNGSLAPGGAQNHGSLDDPAVTSLIASYNTTVGEKPRAGIARRIAATVRDKYYNTYLVSPNETAAYDSSVTGWITPPNEFEYPMITKDLARA